MSLNLRSARPRATRHARRSGDGVHHARAALVLVSMPLVVVIAVLVAVVGSNPSARADAAPGALLEMRDVPLDSVLIHLASLEGGEARVDESVTDHLSGPLVGPADELIELLVDTHGLELYRDGATFWFDREGRTVVDFVPLEKADIVLALQTLSAPVAPGGTVQVEASERGLVLNGSRAYVRTSLARIAMATGKAVEPETPAAAPLEPGLGEANPLPPADGLAGRLVLLSPNEPAYAELEDGTRLTVGSVLDDGRRLVAIERAGLRFERDGSETTVALR